MLTDDYSFALYIDGKVSNPANPHKPGLANCASIQCQWLDSTESVAL